MQTQPECKNRHTRHTRPSSAPDNHTAINVAFKSGNSSWFRLGLSQNLHEHEVTRCLSGTDTVVAIDVATWMECYGLGRYRFSQNLKKTKQKISTNAVEVDHVEDSLDGEFHELNQIKFLI